MAQVVERRHFLAEEALEGAARGVLAGRGQWPSDFVLQLRACFSATTVAENGCSRARNAASRAVTRHAHRPRQLAAAQQVSARLDARVVPHIDVAIERHRRDRATVDQLLRAHRPRVADRHRQDASGGVRPTPRVDIYIEICWCIAASESKASPSAAPRRAAGPPRRAAAPQPSTVSAPIARGAQERSPIPRLIHAGACSPHHLCTSRTLEQVCRLDRAVPSRSVVPGAECF